MFFCSLRASYVCLLMLHLHYHLFSFIRYDSYLKPPCCVWWTTRRWLPPMRRATALPPARRSVCSSLDCAARRSVMAMLLSTVNVFLLPRTCEMGHTNQLSVSSEQSTSALSECFELSGRVPLEWHVLRRRRAQKSHRACRCFVNNVCPLVSLLR